MILATWEERLNHEEHEGHEVVWYGFALFFMFFMTFMVKKQVYLEQSSTTEPIIKLIEEIPENKAGEIIDFLLYLKGREEQDLYLEPEEEAELWKLIQTDERIPAERVDELSGAMIFTCG